jgi:hypothetical protein
MTTRSIPKRHWHSYDNEPLPIGREALDEPFSAFPSWFMWVTCERCGDERMVLDMHAPQRDILDPMRHDGCAGRGGRADRRRQRQ